MFLQKVIKDFDLQENFQQKWLCFLLQETLTIAIMLNKIITSAISTIRK